MKIHHNIQSRKVEPQHKIGELMQHNTPHGLKSANDFLNLELAKDVETNVTLHFREVNTRYREEYHHRHWIQRNGDTHCIELPVQQISWENWITPMHVKWSELTLTLHPVLNSEETANRFIRFEIKGLEKAPGIILREDRLFGVPLYSRKFSQDSVENGYFTRSSNAVLEFKRRWTIEAAAVLQKEASDRLNHYLSIPSFQTD